MMNLEDLKNEFEKDNEFFKKTLSEYDQKCHEAIKLAEMSIDDCDHYEIYLNMAIKIRKEKEDVAKEYDDFISKWHEKLYKEPIVIEPN